jgi:hypothetical protein
MLNEDSSIPENIELIPWSNYEEMTFNSTAEMLEWVQNDKINFELSDKVYDAMLDCLNGGIEGMIVTTIIVEGQNEIDVIIRRTNFQKILSAYVERLLKIENYEKLSKIKREVTPFGLEI